MNELLPYRPARPRMTSNRAMILFIILFFILLLCILYLQSPIARIQAVEVAGNQLLKAEEVIEASGLYQSSTLTLLHKRQIEKRIKSLPEVAQVELIYQFPNTVWIHIKEWQRIGNWETPEGPLVILENGAVLQHRTWQENFKDKPFIRHWKDARLLPKLITELKKLPPSILTQIQSIQPHPKKRETEQIILYMKDGFEVHTTVSELGKQLPLYPQIARYLRQQQLKDGVLHLDEAAWYQLSGKDEHADGDAERGKEYNPGKDQR